MNDATQNQAASGDQKLSPADTLKFLQQMREYHHRALWEEEKHFTWLLSIILGAQIAILNSNRPSSLTLLITGLSIVGVAFSALALIVVRREGAFFSDVQARFVPEFNKHFTSNSIVPPPRAANRSMFLLPFLVFVPWKLSIRDSFQVVFLLFITAFVALTFMVRWIQF